VLEHDEGTALLDAADTRAVLSVITTLSGARRSASLQGPTELGEPAQGVPSNNFLTSGEVFGTTSMSPLERKLVDSSSPQRRFN
jgi:hypothetical protein